MLSSCKKDSNFVPPVSQNTSHEIYLKNVNAYLKANLTSEDYSRINLQMGNISLIESDSSYFFRLPFKDKSVQTDFIALQTDSLGNCSKGNIIHYEIPDASLPANKTVLINNLQRNRNWKFDLAKPVFRETKSESTLVVMIPTLENVTIVCYRHSTNGYTQFTLDNISFLLNPSSAVPMPGGGGGGGGYGVPSAGNTSGDFGTFGNYLNSEDGIVDKVEFERPESEPAIDINKIFKCFDAIPDAGATYEVTINADLPVNGKPDRALNIGLSPGHSFITIRKKNGASTVTKSYGFYPAGGTKSIVDPYGYVSSKIVNNSQHELNSSITKSVTQAQFNTIKSTSIVNAATKNYSICLFNCTDYALAAFNSAFSLPSDKIVLPPFAVKLVNPLTPSTPTVAVINNSPQMLYKYTFGLMNDEQFLLE